MFMQLQHIPVMPELKGTQIRESFLEEGTSASRLKCCKERDCSQDGAGRVVRRDLAHLPL